jgi:hypothetical protein
MRDPGELRRNAAELREVAAAVQGREACAVLLSLAAELEAEAVLLEHGADKPDIIGPPKPPARF